MKLKKFQFNKNDILTQNYKFKKITKIILVVLQNLSQLQLP